MTTFDPERMAAHRAKLEAAGYTRSSVYLSPIARRLVESNRRRGETLTIVVNRLIVGDRQEPPRETAAEAREWLRRIRSAQNELKHAQHAAQWGQPFITRVWLKASNGRWWEVSPADVRPIEGEPPP